MLCRHPCLPACWCVAHAGPGLGVFDAGRVRDLGLPSFEDTLGPVGPGEVSGGTKAQGTPSVAAQKFQLGETLPVVPARIVRRVLRGDYVDMAELTEENLELELRRAADGDEAKSAVPLSRLKAVPDVLTWARSFCLYAGIVVSAHPGKARDLWAYLATLLSGADKGEWWRAYDSHFRQQLPALEAAEFGKLDQALFTRTFLSAGAAGSAQRGGSVAQVEGRTQLGSKRRKLAACYAWNDGKNCVSTPCRFSHVCSRCGGDHRKSLCPPTGEGPAVTPSAV